MNSRTEPAPTKTILVIEENATAAELVRGAFRDLATCTAFVCRNNSEAKAYLVGAGMYCDRREYPFPRAIVSDLVTDDHSALELVRWMKEEQSCRNLPLYILTTSTEPHEAQAKELGAAKVFKKPASLSELQDLLNDLAMKLCD